ncbi:hypothetical protein GGI07_003849 [Coemansia sp. Benny D115]|nr:hypothetical protein GGI07_003849 [Coemansia sp. Benny D115]
MSDNLKTQELYGGAFTMKIPGHLVDISQLREVPDHQEVFADTTASDQSLIVEILETLDHDTLAETLKYHFQQVAEENNSFEHQIQPTQVLEHRDSRIQACWLVGRQRAAKFNEQSANTLCLFMAVLRFAQYDADVLVTWNVPVSIHPQSSSHTEGQPPVSDLGLLDHMEVQFVAMLQSLTLHNVGIFG